MIQNAAGCVVFNQQICTLCPFLISLSTDPPELLTSTTILWRLFVKQQRNFAHLPGTRDLSLLFTPTHFIQLVYIAQIHCAAFMTIIKKQLCLILWVHCACICLIRGEELYHEFVFWTTWGLFISLWLLCMTVVFLRSSWCSILWSCSIPVGGLDQRIESVWSVLSES